MGTKNCYPKSVKRKALRYCSLGREIPMPFACKSRSGNELSEKSAKQIKEKSTKRPTKIDILELYVRCMLILKTFGFGLQLIKKQGISFEI